METKEMIDQLIEMRLTAFEKEQMGNGREKKPADPEEQREWQRALEKLEPKAREILDRQLDRIYEQQDRELMDVYLFGLKDGILLMQKIKSIA